MFMAIACLTAACGFVACDNDCDELSPIEGTWQGGENYYRRIGTSEWLHAGSYAYMKVQLNSDLSCVVYETREGVQTPYYGTYAWDRQTGAFSISVVGIGGTPVEMAGFFEIAGASALLYQYDQQSAVEVKSEFTKIN